MADLSIRVGDLNFSARWEPDAPKTRAAIRGLLPIHNSLIHCRWSGEGCWIPFGDMKVGVGFENHTSHPAPGDVIIYTGDLSEGEILIAYGSVDFSSKVGQLWGNHFATIVKGGDRPRRRGRPAEWAPSRPGHGAQDIVIEELP